MMKRQISNSALLLSSAFIKEGIAKFEDFPSFSFENIPANSSLYINPQDWISSSGELKIYKPSQVIYSGGVFNNCTQEIIKLANGVNMLRLTAGTGQGKIFVIGNGLNSPILTQSWSLLEKLLVKYPNSIIYLTELKGQGLTHLRQDSKKIITSHYLLDMNNAFAHYKKDMKEIIQFIFSQKTQNNSPESKLIAICLSSSCLPFLSAALESTNYFDKIILNGPYLGINSMGEVFQVWFNKLSALGLPFFTPNAIPFQSLGSCDEPLKRRLQYLGETAPIQALHLVNLFWACKYGSQIQNPPTKWTHSANRQYQKLIQKKINKTPQIIIARGSKDRASVPDKTKKLVNILNAEYIEFKGLEHNGFINYPNKIIDLI